MKKIQTLATASFMTAAFAVSPALAGGSIGGDCCADLEERVAELEATTVRKGNRKVSLKLSGHINKSLLWVDGSFDNDGPEIIDNNQSKSRIRLTGKAKISSDLYAGYNIEIGLGDGQDNNISQTGVFSELRKNELYIGSKTLGRLSIGKGDVASNAIAEIDLSGTTYLGGGSTSIVGFSQYVGGDAVHFSNRDGFSRKERVRYDSPTLAGFKLSASWQDNDDTDIALRFASTFGDFKVAGGIAAFHDDSADETTVTGSATAMHIPTGLNVTFAASDDDDGYSYWFIQGGIKQKVFAAGATAVAVGYMETEDAFDVEGDRLSVTLVQNIDAAAMQLYASYTTAETDDGVDLDAFTIGSRIKF